MSCVVILVSRRYRKATWILSSLANCRNDVFWDWSCRLNVRGVVLICLATVAKVGRRARLGNRMAWILPTAPIRNARSSSKASQSAIAEGYVVRLPSFGVASRYDELNMIRLA